MLNTNILNTMDESNTLGDDNIEEIFVQTGGDDSDDEPCLIREVTMVVMINR